MKTACFSVLVVLTAQFSTTGLIAQESPLGKTYKDNLVQSIELLVRDNYVLRQKRNAIASQIHRNNANGDYDGSDDFESLAEQLTSDLQAVSGDGHFLVVYDPTRVAEMRVEDAEDQRSDEEMERIANRRLERERRANFWFRRVEMLDGNIGYLDLRRFSGASDASGTAHAAMAFLAHSDAIIVDLRNNVGGGAPMFILLASYFFGDSPVHLGDIYNAISGETQEFWTQPDLPVHRMPDIRLYLLTSNRTFSAAEEFAYDLKQQKRAVIVGEPTGGGAHMVTRMELNDEYYINMPFAGAVNPITQSNWEGVGVLPDLEVKSAAALEAAHIMILKEIIGDTTDGEYREELEATLAGLER